MKKLIFLSTNHYTSLECGLQGHLPSVFVDSFTHIDDNLFFGSLFDTVELWYQANACVVATQNENFDLVDITNHYEGAINVLDPVLPDMLNYLLAVQENVGWNGSDTSSSGYVFTDEQNGALEFLDQLIAGIRSAVMAFDPDFKESPMTID